MSFSSLRYHAAHLINEIDSLKRPSPSQKEKPIVSRKVMRLLLLTTFTFIIVVTAFDWIGSL